MPGSTLGGKHEGTSPQAMGSIVSIRPIRDAAGVSSYACRSAPDLFFAESPALLARAKALCADCPLRRACLEGALERGEPWGVWGGEVVTQGRVVAFKRGRGRPRKQAA